MKDHRPGTPYSHTYEMPRRNSLFDILVLTAIRCHARHRTTPMLAGASSGEHR